MRTLIVPPDKETFKRAVKEAAGYLVKGDHMNAGSTASKLYCATVKHYEEELRKLIKEWTV